MAGRRHSKGKPTRADARVARSSARLDSRLAVAVSPELRAAASFDALRSAASRSPERGARALDEASRFMQQLTARVTESD